jgi:DNA-binding transcriptional MerR regulator
MNEENLLSVGQFARLAGSTVHTLRHYDAVGLLRPAAVDPRTGYRRYARTQLVCARLIADLRWMGLPIHQVREIIRGPNRPGRGSFSPPTRTVSDANGTTLTAR